MIRFNLHRRGSVLILVLWLLIILGVVGISYTASVRSQLQVAQMREGRLKAYWAARAGIERAMVELDASDLPTLTSADPIFDSEESFANQPVGTAQYSLVVPPVFDGDLPRYGLVDEASRININTADETMLLNIEGLTEDMAQSLIDWRDADSDPQPLGAEEDYYQSLEDPYPVRNAPLASLRELIRVNGWTPTFQAAYPDPYARFAAEPEPVTAEQRETARLILSDLTVWSVDKSLAPDGEAKLDLASANEQTLRRRAELSDVEARSVVARRQSGRFSAPTDLLDVMEAPPPNALNRSPGGSQPSQGNTGSNNNSSAGGTNRPNSGNSNANAGNANSGSSGSNRGRSSGTPVSTAAPQRRVFNLGRVGQIIDYFSVGASQNSGDAQQSGKPGGINLNTASHDVLMTIPGMTEEIASNIVQQREAQGAFQHAGDLADIASIDDAAFRQIYPLVTTESVRFHVNSRGVDPASGATATVEAVISVEDAGSEIIYWREN